MDIVEKIDRRSEAVELVRGYTGKNPYLKSLRFNYENKRGFTLSSFDVDYVSRFHGFEPLKVDKVYEVTDWFAKNLQEKWGTPYLPIKIHIGYLLAELDGSYHCYVKYSQTQEKPVQVYIPKKALFGVLNVPDWRNTEINFTDFEKVFEDRGLTMKPHQKDGVKFQVTMKRSLLADSMGMAKTSVSIMSSISCSAKKVLVLCPASSKTDWREEIGYFYKDVDSYVDILEGSEWKCGKKYTIINYDILDNFISVPLTNKYDYQVDDSTGRNVRVKATTKTRNVKTQKVEVKDKLTLSRKKDDLVEAVKTSPLIMENYDLVIVDEVHKYLSNTTSATSRTFDFFIKSLNPENIYLLSGTPLTNNVRNLYNVLKRINADVTVDYKYYMERFAGMKEFTRRDNGKKFWTYTKEPMNLRELSKKIEHLYLRRTLDEVDGMPRKHVLEKYYNLTTEDRSEYEALWDEYERNKVDEYLKRIKAGDLSEEDMIKLNKDLNEGTLIKKFLAQKTIPHTIKLADEHLKNGEKVFIVCCYDDEIAKFKEYYGDSAVVFHGKMIGKQKDKAKREFQTNPEIKVFIGNIIASGVGITLTAGNVVIFNSFNYRPDENQQVMDRCWRLSQVKDVYVYFQFFRDTAIVDIFNIVLRKELISKSVIKNDAEK